MTIKLDQIRRWLSQPWLLTAVLLLLFDLALGVFGPRPKVFRITYFAGIGISVLIWFFVARLQQLIPRRLAGLFALIIGAMLATMVVSNYRLYMDMGEYTTVWMLRFMNDKASNWIDYINSYFVGYNSVIFFVTLLLFVFIWWPGRTFQSIRFDRKQAFKIVGLFALILMALHQSHVYFVAYRLPLDTSVFTAIKGLSTTKPKKTLTGPYGASQMRQTIRTSPQMSPAAIDVVIILMESWGKEGLSFYGGKERNMPFVAAWLEEEKESSMVFTKAFTTSMFTDISMPALFTSVSSARTYTDLYYAPLIWDWLKKIGMRTVFVSSQKLGYVGMPDFLKTKSLDVYQDQETMHGKIVNDLGMDDLVALRAYLKEIRAADIDTRMFALFNTNAMHGPFQASSTELTTQPQRGGAFENALYISDKVFEGIISTLRETGRYDNTLIVVTSDHGDLPQAARGLNRAVNPYDEILNIPFLVKIPQRWLTERPEAVRNLKNNIDINVSNLDVLPTILDAVNIWDDSVNRQLLDHMDGSSLLRPIANNRWIICTNSNDAKVVFEPAFTLIRGSKRFTAGYRAGIGYYDLAVDPSQLSNLIKATESATLREWLGVIRSNPPISRIFSDIRKAHRVEEVERLLE